MGADAIHAQRGDVWILDIVILCLARRGLQPRRNVCVKV